MTTKYELEQKLEIHGLPEDATDRYMNGEVVTVVALPGYLPIAPLAYGVALKSGEVIPAISKFLRPYPPMLPNGRGDIDKKSTWAEFDKATGIVSAKVIIARPAADQGETE